MTLDLAAFDAALKVHYGPQTLKDIAYRGRPALAMVSKYENFGGRNLPLPVRHANPQNTAADFAAASGIAVGSPATSSSALVEFLLKRKKGYSNAFLDRETMLASRGDVNAFARAADMEIEGAINNCSDGLHIDMFGDGLGTRGQIASVSGATITLTKKEDISRFDVNLIVVVSNGGVRTNALRSDARAITAVDRSAGTITLSSAITGMAANDFIFRFGDRQAPAVTSSAQYTRLSGFDAWLPETAPGPGDSFQGVDRSVDTDRLAGLRIDGSAKTYGEAMTEAVIEISRQGGRADCAFFNPTDVFNFVNELGTKVEYRNTMSSEGLVGFRSLVVTTPMGEVEVIGDHQCPVGVSYVLTKATWKLYSLDGAPHIVDEAGKYLRSHDADRYKVEFAHYAELGCDMPGRNARLTLPTVG